MDISSAMIDHQMRLSQVQLMVFIVTWLVFYTSPVVFLVDSNYSMLMSLRIIEHGTPVFAIDSIPHFSPKETWVQRNGYSWQIRDVNGELLYYYPHGSSVLSIPFVAALKLFRISPANPDGTYNGEGEAKVERLIAATLMSGLTCLFLRMGLFLLPLRWGLVIALGAAFGTQIWSTATRALWSHTWFIFLLGWVTYLLLRAEVEGARLHPMIIATLLSWMYFVRPTAVFPITGVTFFLLLFYRQEFILYAVAGTTWLIAFVVYSLAACLPASTAC